MGATFILKEDRISEELMRCCIHCSLSEQFVFEFRVNVHSCAEAKNEDIWHCQNTKSQMKKWGATQLLPTFITFDCKRLKIVRRPSKISRMRNFDYG